MFVCALHRGFLNSTLAHNIPVYTLAQGLSALRAPPLLVNSDPEALLSSSSFLRIDEEKGDGGEE